MFDTIVNVNQERDLKPMARSKTKTNTQTLESSEIKYATQDKFVHIWENATLAPWYLRGDKIELTEDELEAKAKELVVGGQLKVLDPFFVVNMDDRLVVINGNNRLATIRSKFPNESDYEIPYIEISVDDNLIDEVVSVQCRLNDTTQQNDPFKKAAKMMQYYNRLVDTGMSESQAQDRILEVFAISMPRFIDYRHMADLDNHPLLEKMIKAGAIGVKTYTLLAKRRTKDGEEIPEDAVVYGYIKLQESPLLVKSDFYNLEHKLAKVDFNTIRLSQRFVENVDNRNKILNAYFEDIEHSEILTDNTLGDGADIDGDNEEIVEADDKFDISVEIEEINNSIRQAANEVLNGSLELEGGISKLFTLRINLTDTSREMLANLLSEIAKGGVSTVNQSGKVHRVNKSLIKSLVDLEKLAKPEAKAQVEEITESVTEAPAEAPVAPKVEVIETDKESVELI